MADRKRNALFGLALAGIALAFVPLLGFEHIIFTRPLLTGVLVAWFVRRYALRRQPAVLVAVIPVILLGTLGLLRSSDVSATYRVVVWFAFTVTYVIAAVVGAAVGRRRLARR